MNGDRAVDVFLNKCLRGILQIQWQDLVSTEEVLERADMKPASKEVKRSRWKMILDIQENRTKTATTT